MEIGAWTGGSRYSRNYCHGDNQAKYGGGGTDDNNDPFASYVETDLEEDESTILTLASHYFV